MSRPSVPSCRPEPHPGHGRRQPLTPARDHLALVGQQIFRHVPALVLFTDDLILGNDHIGKKRLAERGNAADHLDRPRLDACLFHVEQQERNALVLGRLTVGAHQRENPVGLVRIRGPDLLTVHQPVIALVLATRLHIRQIRACSGLGIPLAPADLAACNGRQIVQLLFVRSKMQQRGPQHPDAERLCNGERALMRSISS